LLGRIKLLLNIMTFGEKVIDFYNHLDFNGILPPGINIMNPFRISPVASTIARQFYSRFYHDNHTRFLILGINPGRFGAGVTGIPFTDTKRLNEKCGILIEEFQTHEPSSVFIYDVIESFGGADRFYKQFYIGAVSPLGFTVTSNKGRIKNFNYYDNRELFFNTRNFIVDSLKKQIEFGIERDLCFCLGTDRNEMFLSQINKEFGFFKKIISLEHPRYIMQYRARLKQEYIKKYVSAFRSVLNL